MGEGEGEGEGACSKYKIEERIIEKGECLAIANATIIGW